jgi:hypothetical protein
MDQDHKEEARYEVPALRRVGHATEVIRGITSWGDDLDMHIFGDGSEFAEDAEDVDASFGEGD